MESIMEVSIQWILMGIMAAVGGGLMWFLQKTITDLETSIASNDNAIQKVRDDYVHKTEFRDWRDEFRQMLREIQLDVKALRHEKS